MSVVVLVIDRECKYIENRSVVNHFYLIDITQVILFCDDDIQCRTGRLRCKTYCLVVAGCFSSCQNGIAVFVIAMNEPAGAVT